MPTYEKITFEIYNNSIKLLRYFLSNNCKSINGYLFIVQVFELLVVMYYYKTYGESNIPTAWMEVFRPKYTSEINDLRDIRNNLVHSVYDFEGRAFNLDADRVIRAIIVLIDAVDFELSDSEKEKIKYYINDFILFCECFKNHLHMISNNFKDSSETFKVIDWGNND